MEAGTCILHMDFLIRFNVDPPFSRVTARRWKDEQRFASWCEVRAFVQQGHTCHPLKLPFDAHLPQLRVVDWRKFEAFAVVPIIWQIFTIIHIVFVIIYRVIYLHALLLCGFSACFPIAQLFISFLELVHVDAMAGAQFFLHVVHLVVFIVFCFV